MDYATKRHILNALRQATVTWKGRTEALNKVRRKVGEGRGKFYWQCQICREWNRDISSMEVDHIIEIGELKPEHSFKDFMAMVLRMFDPNNLQVLCISCHRKKTAVFNSFRRGLKRKKRDV